MSIDYEISSKVQNFNSKTAVSQREWWHCAIACIAYIVQQTKTELPSSYEYISVVLAPYRLFTYPSEIVMFLSRYDLMYNFKLLDSPQPTIEGLDINPDDIVIVSYTCNGRRQPHYIVYAGKAEDGTDVFMDPCAFNGGWNIKNLYGAFVKMNPDYVVIGYICKIESDWSYRYIYENFKEIKTDKINNKKTVDMYRSTLLTPNFPT